MKHFNIGDKVIVVANQEQPWTYEWQNKEYYIVEISLDKRKMLSQYIDEYSLNYTLSDSYPGNKCNYVKGFLHGELQLVI